jgi:hypothetical protein
MKMKNKKMDFTSTISRDFIKTWFILAIPVGVLVCAFHWYPKYSLSRHNTKCTAYVTAKYPHNHRQIQYSYTVKGVQHSGITVAQVFNKPFEEVSLGDALDIGYDSTKPARSSEYPRDTELAVATSESIAMCMIISLIMTVVLKNKTSNQRLHSIAGSARSE